MSILEASGGASQQVGVLAAAKKKIIAKQLGRSVKANSEALLVLVSQCFNVGHSSCEAWNQCLFSAL